MVINDFKNPQMLKASAMEVCTKFEEKRSDTSESDIYRLIDDAYTAAQFISTNIVQAKLNDIGSYGQMLSFLHSSEVETFDGSSTKVTIYIVTKPVMPLSEKKIKELGLNGQQKVCIWSYFLCHQHYVKFLLVY
ncbi:unnamed protein product [Amaranthus hypochondriacus]